MARARTVSVISLSRLRAESGKLSYAVCYEAGFTLLLPSMFCLHRGCECFDKVASRERQCAIVSVTQEKGECGLVMLTLTKIWEEET
jgi:hypothetical protein